MLNAQLLSEKAKHEEENEAIRTSHASELALEREKHKEEVKRLQEEVKRLQDEVDELKNNKSLSYQVSSMEVGRVGTAHA